MGDDNVWTDTWDESSGDLVGVMYFFSTEPQVFPKAADQEILNKNAQFIAGLLRASEII